MTLKCVTVGCSHFNRTLPNNAKVCPFCGNPTEFEGAKPPPPSPVSPPPLPPRPVLPPTLKLVHTSGQEFVLRGNQASLGRPKGAYQPDIDLSSLPNSEIISRPHADIRWDPASRVYKITDNNSTNRTFVNGVELVPQVPRDLANGMVVQLGKEGKVQFKVVLL
jgi:hypothetical protein